MDTETMLSEHDVAQTSRAEIKPIVLRSGDSADAATEPTQASLPTFKKIDARKPEIDIKATTFSADDPDYDDHKLSVESHTQSATRSALDAMRSRIEVRESGSADQGDATSAQLDTIRQRLNQYGGIRPVEDADTQPADSSVSERLGRYTENPDFKRNMEKKRMDRLNHMRKGLAHRTLGLFRRESGEQSEEVSAAAVERLNTFIKEHGDSNGPLLEQEDISAVERSSTAVDEKVPARFKKIELRIPEVENAVAETLDDQSAEAQKVIHASEVSDKHARLKTRMWDAVFRGAQFAKKNRFAFTVSMIAANQIAQRTGVDLGDVLNTMIPDISLDDVGIEVHHTPDHFIAAGSTPGSDQLSADVSSVEATPGKWTTEPTDVSVDSTNPETAVPDSVQPDGVNVNERTPAGVNGDSETSMQSADKPKDEIPQEHIEAETENGDAEQEPWQTGTDENSQNPEQTAEPNEKGENPVDDPAQDPVEETQAVENVPEESTVPGEDEKFQELLGKELSVSEGDSVFKLVSEQFDGSDTLQWSGEVSKGQVLADIFSKVYQDQGGATLHPGDTFSLQDVYGKMTPEQQQMIHDILNTRDVQEYMPMIESVKKLFFSTP